MHLTVENIENWKKQEDTNAKWEDGSIWNPYDGCLRASRTKSALGNAWLYVSQINFGSVDIVLHQTDNMEIFRSGMESNNSPIKLSCFFDKKYVSLVGIKQKNSRSKVILEYISDTDDLMSYIKECDDFWINISMYIMDDDNKEVQLQGSSIWNFDISGVPKFNKIWVHDSYQPYPLKDKEKVKEWNRIGLK